MPRRYFPSNLSPRIRAAAPVEVERSQIISDWSAVPEQLADGTIYRVVCRAPFDGYVSDAVFTPDLAIEPVADRAWFFKLINAEENGEGRWAITDLLSTETDLDPLITVEFDQNSDPDIPANHPRKDWIVVEEGDLIAFNAFCEIDPEAEDQETRPQRPTGTVTVWFTRTGGR